VFGLEHRQRFERLDNDFRASSPGDTNAVMMRTLARLELRPGVVRVGAELLDARAYTWGPAPLNTTLVNTVEMLRASAGVDVGPERLRGHRLELTGGRLTLDWGSRRLLARNDFRNTINAFTGIDLRWTAPGGLSLRALTVVPIVRAPTSAERLKRNGVELDRENPDAVLTGMMLAWPTKVPGLTTEAYALALIERDGEVAASSDRRLVTPGVRLVRPPARDRLDLQLEAMLQLGTSRASSADDDVEDLQHLASAIHAAVGRRFGVAGEPRPVLGLDFATGDTSPDDGANHRFDPLFAARRFDFGPTGLYGVLARANLVSPFARLELHPHRQVDGFVVVRGAWIASPTDAWVSAGVRDPSGQSGRFIGVPLEARVRWSPFEGNLGLDLGAAVLARGAFARDAPGGRAAPASFVYVQLTAAL
jgi:hypothetical protein